MSTATKDDIVAFPLERPVLRARWRDSIAANLLPYFIAGPENRLTRFLSETPTDQFELGNPILLLGPSGCGKTSIALHLAARQLAELDFGGKPEALAYLPAVDFARAYADAVHSNDMPPFRHQIENVPVLVIDDLQSIANKAPAQDELATRIEARNLADKPTIITCRRLPSQVRLLRPMLVSRVLHGLTVTMSLPKDDSRRQILSELAAVHDLEFDHPLMDELDKRLGPDLSVRELDGCMRRISLWCRMNDSAVALEAITSSIEASFAQNQIELPLITNAVSRRMGLKVADLRSSSRKQMVVRARALAMFMARQLTEMSLDQIGKYFGGRDHSTVLHSIRKIDKQLAEDADLARVMADVREKLQ